MRFNIFDELTALHPTATIKYAVTWLDESGREEKDWRDSYDDAVKLFEEHANNDDDTHLYKSLVLDLGDDGYDELHGEVVESHAPNNT